MDKETLKKLLTKAHNLQKGKEISLAKEFIQIDEKIDNLSEELKKKEYITTELKGEKGIQGERGDQGEQGDKGKPGIDGKQGIRGNDGLDGKDGVAGQNGLQGANGSPDTRKEIIEKINTGKKDDVKIETKQIKDFTNYTDEIKTLQNRTQLLLQIATQRATDLQSALDAKADALTADQNYVSDAELTVLQATSGVNTGDQTLAGLGGAPVGAKYIVQQADATLTAEQALGALATGILKNTTTTGVLSIAIAADFPTLNQDTTGSAGTLTTARDLYGFSFNGSAGTVSGTNIIASGYGGTGNGFTKFTGPITSEKTFTLPNASATLLYSGGALGTPSSGVATNITGLPAASVLAGTFGTGAYVMDTSLTVPTIVGGTGTTSDLNLKTTSGVGTTGADMHFLVGNNGATEAMTILNNGNVGIGTTAPGVKLDIGGGNARIVAPANGFLLQAPDYWSGGWADRGFGFTNSGDSTLAMFGAYGNGAPSTLVYAYIGTTYVAPWITFRPSGNVGIGTTAPSYPLDVQAATGQAYIKSTTGTNYAILRINNTGGDVWVGRNSSTGGALLSTGGLAYGAVVNSVGTNALQLAVNSAAAVTILNGGNVGIGTTAPGAKLDVNGAIYQRPAAIAGLENYLRTNAANFASTTSLNPGILFYDSGANVYGMDLGYVGSNYRTRIFAAGGQDISFAFATEAPTAQTSFSEKMVIRSTGNVGIGTTTPTAKAHIDQSSTTDAIPVITLGQADLSEEFINFVGTVGTGNSIEAVGAKSLTVTHFLRIQIEGVGYRYISCGTIA